MNSYFRIDPNMSTLKLLSCGKITSGFVFLRSQRILKVHKLLINPLSIFHFEKKFLVRLRKGFFFVTKRCLILFVTCHFRIKTQIIRKVFEIKRLNFSLSIYYTCHSHLQSMKNIEQNWSALLKFLLKNFFSVLFLLFLRAEGLVRV